MTVESKLSMIANSPDEIELVGEAVRQLMTANPELSIIHAVYLIGAGVVFSQYALSTKADSIVTDVSSTVCGDWQIELSKVEGVQ